MKSVRTLKHLAFSFLIFLWVFLFVPNINFGDFSHNSSDSLGGIQVYAQGGSPTTSAATGQAKDTTSESGQQTMIQVLNSLLGILTILFSPMIMLAGWLMSPDWVTGDMFQLRDKMYALWQTVSNILYFIYALMLIVIAIATIFNYSKYSYKTMLPRLFLGIILIPWTWWFVQFIISTSTVVTSSLLSIPNDMIVRMAQEDKNANGGANGSQGATFFDAETIPKSIVLAANQKDLPKVDCSQGCLSPRQILKSSAGIYSPLLIYGYSVFKIQDTKTIKGESLVDALKNIGELVNNMLFSVVMNLLFGLLVIALVVVLFVRAIKMWIYAIFSPLFTARIVFKDFKTDDSDTFDIKEFVGLAFMPAVIGLVLSLGLIVVGTIQTGMTANNEQGTCKLETAGQECTLFTLFGNPNTRITQKLVSAPQANSSAQGGQQGDSYISATVFHLGELTLEFQGSPQKNAPEAVGSSFMGLFGTVIVEAISLVFLWTAFMMAGKTSKAVNKVFEPFESFGKSVASASKNTVKMMPVPGIGNLGWLSEMGRTIQTWSDSRVRDWYTKSAVGAQVSQGTTDRQIAEAIRQMEKQKNSREAISSTIINYNIDAMQSVRSTAQSWTEMANQFEKIFNAIKGIENKQVRLNALRNLWFNMNNIANSQEANDKIDAFISELRTKDNVEEARRTINTFMPALDIAKSKYDKTLNTTITQ